MFNLMTFAPGSYRVVDIGLQNWTMPRLAHRSFREDGSGLPFLHNKALQKHDKKDEIARKHHFGGTPAVRSLIHISPLQNQGINSAQTRCRRGNYFL